MLYPALSTGDDLKLLLNVSTIITWFYNFPRGSASVGTAALAKLFMQRFRGLGGCWGFSPLEAAVETNTKMFPQIRRKDFEMFMCCIVGPFI